jgi:carbon storage regulator
MLVVSRKVGQRIIIDERITITVVEIRGNQIRLGIEAPKEVSVQREELVQSAAA